MIYIIFVWKYVKLFTQYITFFSQPYPIILSKNKSSEFSRSNYKD